MSKGAYYNEHEPFAAAWLRELIKKDLIAAGDVDERDIQKVKGDELRGYRQVHLFAGIGGWSYALRLAGWDDARPVWSGSCPCQPFSSAGKRKGEADDRHLWPEMHRLIRECSPAICFGEQVASDDGCRWLAGVFADLEALEYRVAGADLCAAGVRSPHNRRRLFWVAHAPRSGLSRRAAGDKERPQCEVQGAGSHGWRQRNIKLAGVCVDDHEPWARYTTATFTDGKTRRIEPDAQPVAHGVPARVGRLRGYGNAIVPQVAARFIEASIEAISESPQ